MQLLSPILNLLFPPRCASCKTEGHFLCKNCVQSIKVKDIRYISLNKGQDSFDYLDGVIYGLDYSDNPEIKAALAQFKYKFTVELVEHFSALTSEKLQQLNMIRGRQVTLIPVPLHKKRLNYRGFNQAQLLAEATADKMEDSVVVSFVLKRVKETAQQAKLSRQERQRNLMDAFEVEGGMDELKRSVCFLVDDVCTTGATLESCAKVLKEKGIEKVYGLVVARAFK